MTVFGGKDDIFDYYRVCICDSHYELDLYIVELISYESIFYCNSKNT